MIWPPLGLRSGPFLALRLSVPLCPLSVCMSTPSECVSVPSEHVSVHTVRCFCAHCLSVYVHTVWVFMCTPSECDKHSVWVCFCALDLSVYVHTFPAAFLQLFLHSFVHFSESHTEIPFWDFVRTDAKTNVLLLVNTPEALRKEWIFLPHSFSFQKLQGKRQVPKGFREANCHILNMKGSKLWEVKWDHYVFRLTFSLLLLSSSSSPKLVISPLKNRYIQYRHCYNSPQFHLLNLYTRNDYMLNIHMYVQNLKLQVRNWSTGLCSLCLWGRYTEILGNQCQKYALLVRCICKTLQILRTCPSWQTTCQSHHHWQCIALFNVLDHKSFSHCLTLSSPQPLSS